MRIDSILGVSEDLTKIIINEDLEVTPESDVIYVIESSKEVYMYDGEYLERKFNYEVIDGVTEELDKIIVDDEELIPEENIFYILLATETLYTYDGTILSVYEDVEPVIVIYPPKYEFSTFGDKLTLTLDNSDNDYDNFIPHGFKLTNNVVEKMDIGNGVVVTRVYDIDDDGFTHTLFVFEISRTNVPTVMNYL